MQKHLEKMEFKCDVVKFVGPIVIPKQGGREEKRS